MKFVMLFLAGAVLVFPVSAFAHVTANPDVGVAGKYFETAFRISHGCEGSPTVSVSITLPKGLVSVKPQHKAGWIVQIKKSKLDKPVEAGHGKMADEQFDEIIWAGGSLPDDQYDSFGLLLKLPATPGETMWFPVVQTCSKGENRWVEIPAKGQEWHDVKSPAPFVKLGVPGPSSGHQH